MRRVLHVLAGLERAGTETWVVNLARQLQGDAFQLVILVHTAGPFPFDDELRRLNVEVIHLPLGRNPLSYALALWRIMRRQGGFDVVHSHLYAFSGLVLAVGFIAGVPVRLAHCHNDLRSAGKARWRRRWVGAVNRRLLRTVMTSGLAASEMAAQALYGEVWNRDDRIAVLPSAIDLDAVRMAGARSGVNPAIDVPKGVVVIGHVGRMTRQKNHALLLDLMVSLRPRLPASLLLLVGDGELRSELMSSAERMDLKDRVIWAGDRPDVADILATVVDVFVFPSLWEGLGMAAVEAQAAGVPTILSDAVPPEAIVVPELVTVVGLEQPVHEWADAVLEARNKATSVDLDRLDNSLLSARRTSEVMRRIYLGSRPTVAISETECARQ